MVIDNICQELSKHMKKDIRTGSSRLYLSVLPLVEIAKEMRSKKLRIDPLCNIHLHYVQEPPVRSQSKLFAFGPKLFLPTDDRNKSDDDNHTHDTSEVTNGNGPEEDAERLQACAMIIDEPHMHCGDNLEEVSGLRQTITDLYISDKFRVKPGDLEMSQLKRPAFKMDHNAKSITVESTSMPQPVLQDIGSSITSCHQIHSLQLTDIARLIDVAEVGNLSNIRYLNLGMHKK